MKSFISRLLKGIFSPEDTVRKCQYEGLDKNGMRVLSLMNAEDIAAYNRDGDLSSYALEKESEFIDFVNKYYRVEGQI